jgi:hypothetical protein
VVDVVTLRSRSLHVELCRILDLDGGATHGLPDLYAVAYRVITDPGEGRLEAWPEPLAIGRALPTVPLWLSRDEAVPLDLE